MMMTKNEVSSQARTALSSVTEDLGAIDNIDVDHDFYHEDETARLTITVEYRMNTKQGK